MHRPRDSATLREAVLGSGFTPGGRDIEAIVGLLADDDEAVARGAERALVRAAASGAMPSVVERVLGSLAGASPELRALGWRLLGRLAPTDAATATALMTALGDADTRVQRAAAHALGRLGGSERAADIAGALLGAWDAVPDLPMARALAEALGKLGPTVATDGARERLRAALTGDRELARVARKALAMLERDGSRGDESEIDGAREAAFDVHVVLSCRAGLEAMVREELLEKCASASSAVGAPGTGQVTAVWRGAPERLFAVRTMIDFAFASPVATGTNVETACADALTGVTAARILETWTRGVVRYRIDWAERGHRRGATWAVVHAVAERRPSWVNDPTESTWQVTVQADRGRVRLLLSPQKLRDPRFTYRLRDVPAASHPTLAAALVRASRPRPDDVVWDPFVGSGTELIERSRAGPFARLVGSDLDPTALTAARENAEAAGTPVVLETGDATTHAPPGVTCIITNPPMGRRVTRDGTLAVMLDAFTDHVARVLGRGGRLAWLSPLGGRTAARAEASGLRVSLRQPVDMGGFHAELQVWEKG
jgi:23S rRNA G2445 N2-methylase RlmL